MADDERFEVTIIFKSGASFKVEVASFEVGRNRLGDVISAKWNTGSGSTTITDIDLSEIAAVFKTKITTGTGND
jgi:hypothetical protein